MITSVIDAKEGREVAVIDIPNAFVQTEMEGERVIMKMHAGNWQNYLSRLHWKCTKIMSSLREVRLSCTWSCGRHCMGCCSRHYCSTKNYAADLEKVGFVVNPYDPCVANKVVDGSQMTVVWHVDDLKISHVKKKCVDDFIDWAKSMYEDKVGKVKASRGKQHDYLGMEMDFSQPGSVKVKMERYVREMVATFSGSVRGSEGSGITGSR